MTEELDDVERQLRIELMTVQIDKGRVDIEKLRAEIRHMERWEPWKALAAILTGVAAMAGVMLAVAHFIH
jgi:hypothetical protein